MSRPVSIPILLEGWVENPPAVEIEGLCRDSHRVEPGQAFVHTGSGCPQQAAARGARVVIHGGGVDLSGLSIPDVELPGLGGRLSALAARFHRHPADQLKIAAVATGGKGDSVAHYIAQSWQRVYGDAGLMSREGHGPFSKQRRSIGGLMTDTLALQETLSDCLDAGADMVAMEVQESYLQQGWLDEIAFDAAVLPGTAGIDTARLYPLFTDCRPGFAIVNHDTAEGKTLTRLMGGDAQVLTFGTNGATELHGSILGMDSLGMTISLSSPWGGGQLRTGLLGRENLSSLLAAAGALALMGMPWNKVMHQLEIMSAVPGRMSCVEGEPGQPAAVIDNARTPEALENVLLALRSHLHGRLYCVLAAPGRRMVRVAESFSDRVFLADVSMQNDAVRQATRLAIGASGRGDIVLIAGAGQGSWRRGGEAEVRDLLEEAA